MGVRKMSLEWLGKYRTLIGNMMRFANAYARNSRYEHSYNTPVKFTPSEIHVLEYILEHENHFENMVGVADILGITKGALSKNVKKMESKGLLEKYHTADNQKNIIIRVTPYGKEVYEQYTRFTYEVAFKRLFEELDTIPDEYLEKFARILELAAEFATKEKEADKSTELIKIEENK